MASVRRPALRGVRLASALWRLLRIYWGTADARGGALLLAGAIALELLTVQASLYASEAQRRLVEGLELRDAEAFFTALGFLVSFLLVFVLVSTYRIYVRQTLEVRWRRGLTTHFLGRWIGPNAYGQSQLHGDEIDNPDQRIAEDIRDFVASALGLSLSLLSAVSTLVAFGGLLWSFSAGWQVPIAGWQLQIPGLLLWVAIVFAIFSMGVTHLTGRRLVPINFDRLRMEADFRYGLVRFRDNVEQIALSGGEAVERAGAVARFRHVVHVFTRQIRAERNLNLLTGGVGQLSSLAPFLIAAPGYFANLLTIGMIVQARVAYDQVSGALLWFVNAYREIARWRANIERLASLLGAMDATQRELAVSGPQLVEAEGRVLRLEGLRLETREGRVLLDGATAQLSPGERVAVVGAAGVGKSTLFRALAGIWPFGSGRVERPPSERMFFLPQRPYLPLGTLRAAVSYPAAEGSFSDARIGAALELVGLGQLVAELDQVESWQQRVSEHEQQLLAFARVLLHEPDWLLLDRATSNLDEASEKKLYELLLAQLPHTSVLSCGVRGATLSLLPRRWTLAAEPGGAAVLRAA